MNPLLVNEKLAGFLKEDIGFGDLSVSYLPTDKVLTGYRLLHCKTIRYCLRPTASPTGL